MTTDEDRSEPVKTGLLGDNLATITILGLAVGIPITLVLLVVSGPTNSWVRRLLALSLVLSYLPVAALIVAALIAAYNPASAELGEGLYVGALVFSPFLLGLGSLLSAGVTISQVPTPAVGWCSAALLVNLAYLSVAVWLFSHHNNSIHF